MYVKRGDFWSNVAQLDSDSCWIWTGGIMFVRDFRGYFRNPGKTVYAHREAWRLTYGEIPEGMCVCHKCDVTLCCNPSHLFLGTQAENVADMRSKGRGRYRGTPGETNSQNKLTESQVKQVLEMIENKTKKQCEIASELGVSEALISCIKKGRIWKHLTVKKAKGAK